MTCDDDDEEDRTVPIDLQRQTRRGPVAPGAQHLEPVLHRYRQVPTLTPPRYRRTPIAVNALVPIAGAPTISIAG